MIFLWVAIEILEEREFLFARTVFFEPAWRKVFAIIIFRI